MHTFLTEAKRLNTYLVSDHPELKSLADRLFPDILAHTKINNKYRLKEALKIIIINLYEAYVKNRAVRYSRDKNSYQCGTRYTEIWFKYNRIIPIIDALITLGYVHYKDGIHRPNENVLFQSRIWAAQKLVELFYEYQFKNIKYIRKKPPKEIIQLRERKEKINGKKVGGRWLDYTDNHKTETMRDRLSRYNKFIDKQDVQVSLSGDVCVNLLFLEKLKSNIVSQRIEIIKLSTDADAIFKFGDEDKEYSGYVINGFEFILADENITKSDNQNIFSNNKNIHNSNPNQYFTHYINHKYISHNTTQTPNSHNKHLSMSQSKHAESPVNPTSPFPSTPTIDISEAKHSKDKNKKKEKRPLSEYGISHLSFKCNQQLLHRVFVKNEDFSLGGRFYGAVHEDLPKEVRPHIIINGSPTVEPDFGAHHVRLLYVLKGISYEGKDPYVECCNSEDERPILKKIILVAINAKDERGAILAAKEELWKKGFRGACLKHHYISDCIKRFKEHHPTIAGLIHKDRGISLQNDDSHITDEILYQMVSKNIPVLPVHDSYIVPREHADTLRAVMVEAYKKRIGKEFTPVIK